MSGAHIRGKEYWQSEKANLIRLYQEEKQRIRCVNNHHNLQRL